MSNVNTNTQATATAVETTTTNSKENTVKKFNIASLKAVANKAANETNKAVSTTGKAVVEGVRQGHETGCRYVAIITDKIDNCKYLVKGETKEGVLAQAKEITKTLVRFTLKVVAVPSAYFAGLVIGFGKGVFGAFKTAYNWGEEAKATDSQVKAVEDVATETVHQESN